MANRKLPPAAPFLTRPASPDDIVATGLQNLWYLVARSTAVRDRPVMLTRLDRNLVLWRDERGTLNVLEDYCPHRGAPLSMGHVTGGNVVCPYHGIMLDGRGVVTAVPPTPGCPLVGQKSVRAYPWREIGGAIWVYFGADEGVAPPEPMLPEELRSAEWSSFLFTDEWACNWQLPVENRVDPIHGSYLHTGTFTMSLGRKDAKLIVTDRPQGFETHRDNQRGVNIDWHEVDFVPGNIVWVRTEITYPPAVGGGAYRINGFATPIDRDHTLVWFFRSRKVSGWQRDMWRFLYKQRWGARADEVIGQDRVLLERVSVDARRRERLIQTDIAIVRMRRLIREEAERQFQALDAANAGAGAR
mgnify:CR=1 FL=1